MNLLQRKLRKKEPPKKKSTRKDQSWREEWKGMPDFEQEKQEPYKQITIRFETEADYKNFAKLIDQNLTPKTKSIWHPHKPHRNKGANQVWKSDQQ